jgi:predicted MFS family arabinose efflux permease
MKYLLNTGYTLFGVIVTLPLIFLGIYAYELGGIIYAALIYSFAAAGMGFIPRIIAPFSDLTKYRIKYAAYCVLIGSLILTIPAFFSLSKEIIITLLILSASIIQIAQPLFLSYETERNYKTGVSVGNVFMYVNVGYLLGSLLYALVIHYAGFKESFILTSLLGLITFLTFFKFKEIPLNYEGKVNVKDLKSGIDIFNLANIAYIFVPAFSFSILPVLYVEYLKGEILDWGYANIIATITSIIGSYYVGYLVDKLGFKRTISFVIVYYPLYYYILYIFPNIPLFIIMYSVPAWLFLWIPVFSYSSKISKPYERATALANVNLYIGIFRSSGGICAGLVINEVGFKSFLLIGTIIALIFSFIIILLKEKV